ncbi:hypothetical protein F4782DRAFT_258795 [Xylaria castorea]|nr:hypothetical protein F4782DRAFT_258795 [Xylaria castorea]
MEAAMAIQRNHLHGTVCMYVYYGTAIPTSCCYCCYYYYYYYYCRYYFYSPSDTVTVAKVARAIPPIRTLDCLVQHIHLLGPSIHIHHYSNVMYIDLISTNGHPSYNKEDSPSTPPLPSSYHHLPSYYSRATPLERKSSRNKYNLACSGAIGLVRNLVHL